MEPFVSNVWALTFALQSVHSLEAEAPRGKGRQSKATDKVPTRIVLFLVLN